MLSHARSYGRYIRSIRPVSFTEKSPHLIWRPHLQEAIREHTRCCAIYCLNSIGKEVLVGGCPWWEYSRKGQLKKCVELGERIFQVNTASLHLAILLLRGKVSVESRWSSSSITLQSGVRPCSKLPTIAADDPLPCGCPSVLLHLCSYCTLFLL